MADYVRESLSVNTRRAYLADLAQFAAWGGSIPSSPEQIASYLAEHAGLLSVATLIRRLSAITRAHEARGLPSPVATELVRATVRGIKRRWGCAQDQAKPLLKEDLFQVLDSMGTEAKDARDRALLLLGFAGGFRRSEIVGLDVADIENSRQGLIVNLRRSKTDQEGAGRKLGVPYGRTRFCPVLAVERWLKISGITSGAIFRPINRHGQVAPGRLSGDAVSVIIKERAAAAGYEPGDYSGHSLRSGFVTSAAMAGVASWRIRRQTGHTNDLTLDRYIRSAEMFADNAAGALL